MNLKTSAFFFAATLAACGAPPNSTPKQPLNASPLELTQTKTNLVLQATPGFADERGGGIFIDLDGRAVRLRADGSLGPLENHPLNPVQPGRALAAWPMTPFTALVGTDKGFYLASSGWLISLPWRDAISVAGVKAVSLSSDGVGWIAHEQGLFRITDGKIYELKIGGGSFIGLDALTHAPAPDGTPAMWFSQGDKLNYAIQTEPNVFKVFPSGLDPSVVQGGIFAIAGIGPSATSKGELWVAAKGSLWRLDQDGWFGFSVKASATQLLAAGRVMWMRAGDALFRYEADSYDWKQVSGFEVVPSLMAAEASGTAWVRVGKETLTLSRGVVPRVYELFEGVRVYSAETPVKVAMPKASRPTEVSFKLDDKEAITVPLAQALEGEGLEAGLVFFSMAGFDGAGKARPQSFNGELNGVHGLKITATYDSGKTSGRTLNFDFRAGMMAQVGYAKDMVPLFAQRCAKCHTDGPGHPMTSYDVWKKEKDKILSAVVEGRMPADGPMDPAQIQLVQRWVNGGAAP